MTGYGILTTPSPTWKPRKKLLMKSCVTCWDPSIDWALDGLKIIRELLKRHEARCEVGELELLIVRIHEEKRETYD